MKYKMQILVTICALFPLASMEAVVRFALACETAFVDKQSKKPVTESLPAPDKIRLQAIIRSPSSFAKAAILQNLCARKVRRESAAPLLFVLHGGGGNMDIQSNDEFYKQISKSGTGRVHRHLSERVEPVPVGELATWNAGRCCGFGRDSQKDDVEFIRQI